MADSRETAERLVRFLKLGLRDFYELEVGMEPEIRAWVGELGGGVTIPLDIQCSLPSGKLSVSITAGVTRDAGQKEE